MQAIPRDERGMALAIAIFALLVVGAMIAGAFFAGTQEQRVGENQRRVTTSFGVAEAGAQERVLSWDPATMNKRPVYCPCPGGDSVAIGPSLPAPNGTGSYGGYSYKVGQNLFVLDVTSRDQASASGTIAGGGGARERVGIIARIAPIDFDIKASLTTQGGVRVGGTAEIDGGGPDPDEMGQLRSARSPQSRRTHEWRLGRYQRVGPNLALRRCRTIRRAPAVRSRISGARPTPSWWHAQRSRSRAG